MRGPRLAAYALACIWLAALSSCDAVKSERNKYEYVDELVAELCAPGAFYLECWWETADLCHREMPTYVVNSLPTFAKRIQVSEGLRQDILERVFFFHMGFLSPVMSPVFEKEVCMDETLWKHVPPGKVGEMAKLRARKERRRRERRDAPLAPAAGVAPEP